MKKRLAFLILLLVGLSLPLGGCAAIIDFFGGDFDGGPEEMQGALSPLAKNLITRAYQDIDVTRIVDHHVHVAGIGCEMSSTLR